MASPDLQGNKLLAGFLLMDVKFNSLPQTEAIFLME